jgi:hypothetical protein
MKAMPRLVCGIVLSLIAAPTLTQQRVPAWNEESAAAVAPSAWHEDPRPHDFRPPVPRGDLRGDIESIARERLDTPHPDAQRRR